MATLNIYRLNNTTYRFGERGCVNAVVVIAGDEYSARMLASECSVLDESHQRWDVRDEFRDPGQTECVLLGVAEPMEAQIVTVDYDRDCNLPRYTWVAP